MEEGEEMTDIKFCIKCGCKLTETSWGRKFCRNCGMLEENQNGNYEDNDKHEGGSYIG
jgi:uncharacterized Zn finger protein (UPF0148 family)